MICHLQAGRKFHTKPEGLRTGGTNGVSPSPTAAEGLCLSWSNETDRENPTFLNLFVLFEPQQVG